MAAGGRAAWAEVPGFWSEIGTHTLKYAAWGDGYDEVVPVPDRDGAFTVWYGRDDRVVGVLTHHNDADYGAGHRARQAWRSRPGRVSEDWTAGFPPSSSGPALASGKRVRRPFSAFTRPTPTA